MRRVAGLPVVTSALLPLLLPACSLALAPLSGYLNGSLVYAPACLAMLALGCYDASRAGRQRSLLLCAALVFLLAMTLRSIDLSFCDTLVPGTHFLWHLLSALVIYLAMRALLLELAGRAVRR